MCAWIHINDETEIFLDEMTKEKWEFAHPTQQDKAEHDMTWRNILKQLFSSLALLSLYYSQSHVYSSLLS